LLAPDGLFMDEARTAWVVGKSYALRTTTGEEIFGQDGTAQVWKGFCVSVSELNDALLGVTMEGTPGALGSADLAIRIRSDTGELGGILGAVET
jgi:hypothetical protein